MGLVQNFGCEVTSLQSTAGCYQTLVLPLPLLSHWQGDQKRLSLITFSLMMKLLVLALRSLPEVETLQVGGIMECLALFADNLILFIRDPGPFLQASLHILDDVSIYSGLRVNWSKSSILLLNKDTREMGDPGLLLCLVSKMTYLGVHITANVVDYMAIKLTPLLALLNRKIQAWKNLPLSLIGRIKLLKMKILPIFLYFLCHTPIWLPKVYFKKIYSMFSSFHWSHSSPQVSLKTMGVVYLLLWMWIILHGKDLTRAMEMHKWSCLCYRNSG